MTALEATPADLAAVEAIVRRAGTSFYRGMRILPADRRAAMYAIYAFCRLVDDVADEPAPIAQKHAELARWRDRIKALYEGKSDDPVTNLLLAAIRKFDLRREDFEAVIDGMQTDADIVVVAPSMAELDLYCDQVASAVGRLSVRAFGDSTPRADEVAYHLGRALQFTNILRDLAEDAARGRLYLPAELLNRHSIRRDPAAALQSPNLAKACLDLADEAKAHFRGAQIAMQGCDRKAMRPARLMGETYGALLDALIASGFRDPAKRVSLSKWRKIWIALKYAI
jgi:phytoene synthase